MLGYASKSEKLEEYFRNQVLKGFLRPGQRVSSFRELSKQLNVTTATISKAVSRLAAEGIFESTPGRGTFVCEGFKKAKSGMWGVICGDVANSPQESPALVEIMSGMEKEAIRSDDHLVFSSFSRGTIVRGQIPPLISDGKVDGVALVGESDSRVYEVLSSINHPVVSVLNYSEKYDFPTVVPDDFDAAYKLTNHLLDLGHKRIGMTIRISDARWVQDRVEGYKKAMIDRDLDFNGNFLFRISSSDDAKAFVDNMPSITALICITERYIPIYVETLEKNGLSVPKDLSITSFNNILYKQGLFTKLGITSVNIDFELIGIKAAKMLYTLREGHMTENRKDICPVELVVRESTGVPKK